MPRHIQQNTLRLTVCLLTALATAVLAEQDGFVYPAKPIVGPVYYVAPYGNDSHSKSQAANASTPWRTLQHAANNVVAGDTVVVRDGIYTGGSAGGYLLSISRSGTANAPIRFVSETRWGAVLDGQYSNHSPVRFYGASHVILEGFEIRHGWSGGIWSNRNSGNPSYNTIRGNWVHDIANNRSGDVGGGSGILVGRYERYYTIEGNIVHDAGRLPDPENFEKFDWGMYLLGHGHVVKNNILFANIGGGDLRIDGGIGDSPAPPDNERAFVVMNNTFAGSTTRNKRQISLYRNGSGHTPRNVLIMNNVFWNAENDPPIWLGSGGWPWYGTEVINNITTENALINYRSGSSAAQFNCSTCNERRLEGNIVNGQGTLGMRSPKIQGAVESDFSLTSSATLLIDQGRALHRRNGLQDVHAPTVDYRGTMRPQGTGRDLGAYEWKP